MKCWANSLPFSSIIIAIFKQPMSSSRFKFWQFFLFACLSKCFVHILYMIPVHLFDCEKGHTYVSSLCLTLMSAYVGITIYFTLNGCVCMCTSILLIMDACVYPSLQYWIGVCVHLLENGCGGVCPSFRKWLCVYMSIFLTMVGCKHACVRDLRMDWCVCIFVCPSLPHWMDMHVHVSILFMMDLYACMSVLLMTDLYVYVSF